MKNNRPLSDVIYGTKFWVIMRSVENKIYAFSAFDLKGNPVYTTTNGSQKELEKYLDSDQIRKYI